MQVNNTFSAGRFGAYFKKHLVDNYRFYLMSIVVLAGLALLMLFVVTIDDNSYSRYSELIPIYLIGLFFTGSIFTSMSFSELGNKPHGMDYLLLPASHLEKFLTTLLITTIGFLLVYHLAFFFAVKAFDVITNIRKGHHLINDMVEYNIKDKEDPWYYYYYPCIVAHAINLLGAVYFHKYSLIKTTFSCIVFGLFLYFLNAVFTQIIFHDILNNWNEQFPFVAVNVKVPEGMRWPDHYRQLTQLATMTNLQVFILVYLATPVLWTIAYFKLREKEI